jgi:hypothetical protein
MKLPAFAATLLACLALAGPARADFSYQFADAGGTASSNFTVSQGGTVDIRVYLLQTGGSTNLTAAGLTDGGVSLTFSASGPFTVTSTANIFPGPDFGGTNHTSLSTNSGTTTATVQVHNSTPVLAPTSGADQNRILLGTFRFSGVTPGSDLTVTTLPDPNSANNIDGNGVNLDSMIHNSSAAITVTAVPEPGSIVLTGLAASGFGFGLWKRRRRKVLAPA